MLALWHSPIEMKKRWTRRRILFLALFICSLVVILRWFEHSQIYHPGRDFRASGSDLGRPFDDVFFETADGVKLNGWFFPADTNSPRAEMAILYCHGNGGNISHRLDVYQVLLGTGVNLYTFDYRGYGRSLGTPSEEGTYLDAQAAYQWLRAKGFAETNIIVYGESLGGGIASELCMREKTRGVILQSTFTSIPDIGAELYPWLPVRWIASIKYDTHSKLPNLHVPVLILHSKEDELVRFHHAEENFAVANEPKLLRKIGGSHGDALADHERFVNGLDAFFSLPFSPSPSSAARERQGKP